MSQWMIFLYIETNKHDGETAELASAGLVSFSRCLSQNLRSFEPWCSCRRSYL